MGISFRYRNVKALKAFVVDSVDEMVVHSTVFYNNDTAAGDFDMPPILFYQDGDGYHGEVRGMRNAFTSRTSFEACFKLVVRSLAPEPVYDNADVVIDLIKMK